MGQFLAAFYPGEPFQGRAVLRAQFAGHGEGSVIDIAVGLVQEFDVSLKIGPAGVVQ
ncbi:MAG: hypothetical protein JWM76_4550 [Pseudonocardiales bacterium]|nr:hypothetical protein [Pseudonocardiales bacterium]